MQLIDVKRPKYFISLGLLLVLIIICAVVFHPDFQKKMLMKYGAPAMDSLSVERVHFTPWSINVEKLAAAYEGGLFKVESGTVKYCLSSLLLLNLNISQINFQGVDIDISEFNPPPSEKETESGIFPGVLASLDHGLGYILQEINVDAKVKLPEQQSVEVVVAGGDIRPKQKGEINVFAQFYTGVENEVIEIADRMILDQLKRGDFASIENLLNVSATLEALPKTENVSIKLMAKPAPESEESIPGCGEENDSDCISPEILSVLIKQDDDAGLNRSFLHVNGSYNGNNGWYSGDYKFTANELLVKPYMEDKEIPPTHEQLTGDFNLNFADFTGDVSFINSLELTNLKYVAENEKVPQLLELKNNIHLFLLPDNQIRIDRLDAEVADEGTTKPLSATIPADLNIPLNDLESFLSQDNTLIEFELPEIPIAWLDFLAPEYEITKGSLSGGFKIFTDKESVIHVDPLKPLVIHDLTVLQGEETLIDEFDISLLPKVAYKQESVDVELNDFSITTKKGTLTRAKANTTMYLAGETQGTIVASTNAVFNVHNLLNYLEGDAYSTKGIPETFSLNLNMALNQQEEQILVSKLDANLNRDKTRLLNLGLLQPLIINTAENTNPIGNTKGRIANLKISDIQLAWFSAFVPDTDIKGHVQNAEFYLSMDANKNSILEANRPLVVKNVNITSIDGEMIKDIGLGVSPRIVLNDNGTQITYADLNVTGGRKQLVSGSGNLVLANDENQTLSTAGKINVDLQAAAKQPVVSNALQADIVSPVRFESDYKLATNANSITIDKLKANLFYTDSQPKISLNADSKVRIRTNLGSKQNELNRASGKITFEIFNLTSDPFVEILEANGISFTEVSGKAVLTSDGKSLKIDGIKPFTISNVAVSSEEGATLNPFNVVADADVTMQGDELIVLLNPINLVFVDQADIKALDANVDLTMKEHKGKAWVENLDTNVTVSLPVMLDQPGVMPNHKLKTGQLNATINLNAEGVLDSVVKIHDLTSDNEIPLQLVKMDIDGQIDPDTSFSITAPLRTVGNTGESDMLVQANHTHREDENNFINATIDSSAFYLNDILDTLNAISGNVSAKKEEKQEASEEEAEPMVEQDLTPDEKAFWDVIPYNIDATYEFDQLYYTEFLIIHGIIGRTEISPNKFILEEFEANFHESPIKMDMQMTHTPSDTPYDLNAKASVKDFDAKTFFEELVPGSTPRAEGLFNVKFTGSGNSPNMAQYRNNLLFDLRFHGEEGVFRLLDPDSALVGGATGFMGALGETVSYVPTGLFGVGAVSRLVDYIKVIEYDLMDVHLVRDETRDLQIKEYVVQNPELLMTASGGVEFQQNKDILHSPLDMDANLDFRGKGAAIMYDLNLMEKERNEYGYWKGPAIKFWGTPANNQSNLDEVVSKAGRGAILGGITRPISGLLGNAKHRWFGDRDDPIPYKLYNIE